MRRMVRVEYSQSQKSLILARAHQSLDEEFNLALATNDIDAFMTKYNVSFSEQTPQIVTKKMKILVVGDLRGREGDYIKVAREYGFKEENFEFVSFDEIKDYPIEKLRYSDRYSDIIVGALPHKINNIGSNSSLITMLEKEKDASIYPKLIKVFPNQIQGKLKFTISAFKEALKETKLIREINNIY